MCPIHPWARQAVHTSSAPRHVLQAFAQTIGGVPGAVPGLMPGAVPGMVAGGVAAMPAAAAVPGAPAGATTVVLLENVMNVGSVRVDAERRELQTDVYQEASKFGNLTGITIPVPPPTVSDR